MLNILIADDHSIVRYGLALLTRNALGESCVIDFARSGKEVLQCLHKKSYHMLLSDLMMPDQKGISLIGSALEVQPGLRIIIISVGPERDFAARCLDNGACAYLNKGVSDRVFEEVIRSVAHDEERYHPDRRKATAVAATIKDMKEDRFSTLSQREREVVLLLLRGQSIKEIAQTLSLSSSAASTLKARAFAKLQLHSVIELNRLAYYHGLDPDGAILP